MRLAPIAAVLLLACAIPAAHAQDVYAIYEDQPSVGSTIKRRLVSWPVPINRTYAQLGPEHLAQVRKAYPDLAAGDEPPYPLRGMEPLLREIAVVQRGRVGQGTVRMLAKVDEAGEAQSVAVLESPSQGISQLVGFALMQQKYKPGTCAGKPCARDFVFEHTFVREVRAAPSEDYRPYDPAR